MSLHRARPGSSPPKIQTPEQSYLLCRYPIPLSIAVFDKLRLPCSHLFRDGVLTGECLGHVIWIDGATVYLIGQELEVSFHVRRRFGQHLVDLLSAEVILLLILVLAAFQRLGQIRHDAIAGEYLLPGTIANVLGKFVCGLSMLGPFYD